MDKAPETKPNILEVAWKLYAQFDAATKKRAKAHNQLRISIIIISLLATLFAILSHIYPASYSSQGASVINKFLIILPILASILAAFSSKFFPSGRRLVLRAGAELVQKEIYQYRTILQNSDQRSLWLEKRLREIHLQVFNGLNGEMILESYKGKLPPGYDQSDKRSDPGFHDLSFEEYYNYRVKDQLDWHVQRVNRFDRERIFMQLLILFAGGIGTFLAALGGTFSLWVAFATALTSALIGWQELRNVDKTVQNYSKIILELTAISNHWNNLEPNQRSNREFYNTVQSTETLLWNQNVEYIKSMQEVLEASKTAGDDLVGQTIENSESNGASSSFPFETDAFPMSLPNPFSTPDVPSSG